ncbi:Adck1 [Symbiodinium sp. CCMP2592]|nr:Adck1 [Symbiodinium sp. CCMP2592]
MRPKAAEADAAAEGEEADSKGPKKVIWDTADLTWWDFYKRRWTTLWLMKNVYTRYKTVLEQTEGLPEGPQREAIWQECHAISAVELKRHAEEAKGLFIKAGQVMSAMVGTLPDAFTQEFLSLTDHLPVSTVQEVYRTIQRTFHQAPKDIFCEFDPEPLASASIAQVHRARLRATKKIVAVKVQHDGVDRIFLEDIETLTAVAEQLAAWWPDLDFRKFAEEWRESLPRELDFTHERTALERAGKALREAGNWCVVPEVHLNLCGPHVFVMEFIDAGPILDLGDAKFCEENKVDKHRVLEELIHAFGIMAFRDGMFHADPHAGNVRLKVDAKAPGGARHDGLWFRA